MATRIEMEHVKGDINLQVDNPAKSAGNLIEWNVDMKVTVSNVKKSKLFQRSRTVLIFLTAIVFAVLLSHLRKEVRSLQTQVQSVNVNLLLLMSKYDKLNRSLNRGWIQRSERFLESRHLYEVKRLLEGAASITKAIEIFDGIHNGSNGSPRAYESVVSYSSPINRYPRNKYREKTNNDNENADVHGNGGGSDENISKSFMKRIDGVAAENTNDANVRFERAILTLEKQNGGTERRVRSYNATDRYDRDQNDDDDDVDDDDYYYNNKSNDEDLGIWREPRSRRSRRDEGRGKKRGKNRRRPKRSHRRLGPLVATFVGAIPEQHVTDTVYIGPWVKSTKNNTQFSLNKFHLVEDKKSIEVTATGLYMISAQIFYFGEPTNYSYWILLSSEGKSRTQKLVKCSTASSTSATEVSCYTSVIVPLQRGDRVHIQQQERDRLINMREGHSYIQLVLLSNNFCKKRIR